MKEQQLIKQSAMDILGGGHIITPQGWVAGLGFQKKLEKQKPEAAKLVAALKRRIKANNRSRAITVSVADISAETGLSEAYIVNVIDARLIEHLWHKRSADWSQGQEGKRITVPTRFYMEELF